MIGEVFSWDSFITHNAHWISLGLTIILLIGFYRKYRGMCIKRECELLAKIEIEKLKKELAEVIKAKDGLETELNRFQMIFKRLPLVVNGTITLSDVEAFHFYMLLKNDPSVISHGPEGEWNHLFHFADVVSDHFYSRLFHTYPLLGWKELRLCCLMRLRFSNQEISVLLGCIKEESVIRNKCRLKQLLNANGHQTISCLEEYIIKY
ncbi:MULTISPECIES: hypothetical protein [Bacteroides]|uniref:hypothetical protein n=1 Tax=Bacteroides TaxID=816 RepID=UPI00319DE7D9